MVQIELEKVKEIKIDFGSEEFLIPKKYIKKFQYSFNMKDEENIENPKNLKCDFAFLNLDLKYLEISEIFKNTGIYATSNIAIIYYNEEPLNLKLPSKYEINIQDQNNGIPKK